MCYVYMRDLISSLSESISLLSMKIHFACRQGVAWESHETRISLGWCKGETRGWRDVRQYAADIDSGDLYRGIDARQCTVERDHFLRRGCKQRRTWPSEWVHIHVFRETIQGNLQRFAHLTWKEHTHICRVNQTTYISRFFLKSVMS